MIFKIVVKRSPVVIQNVAPKCHANWFNRCKTNADCCSSNCFRGENNDWMDGVCHPTSMLTGTSEEPAIKECQQDWNNTCHSNKDCCSGNCFMGESNSWFQGVSYPVNSTELIKKECLPKSTNCMKSVDCCTGYCENSPPLPNALHFGICKSREIQGSTQRLGGKNFN